MDQLVGKEIQAGTPHHFTNELRVGWGSSQRGLKGFFRESEGLFHGKVAGPQYHEESCIGKASQHSITPGIASPTSMEIDVREDEAQGPFLLLLVLGRGDAFKEPLNGLI
jgi:hypothetical protein